MPESTPSSVYCPVNRTTVDVERCAACAWRTGGRVTCVGDERAEAREGRSLLRLLP